jgi:hypothetical protein
MPQHYRDNERATYAVCGFNMLGMRNIGDDLNKESTTCIKCKAINEGRPLYALTFVDDEGMSDQLLFNTSKEQLDNIEGLYDQGAVMVTLQIIATHEINEGYEPPAYHFAEGNENIGN